MSQNMRQLFARARLPKQRPTLGAIGLALGPILGPIPLQVRANERNLLQTPGTISRCRYKEMQPGEARRRRVERTANPLFAGSIPARASV